MPGIALVGINSAGGVQLGGGNSIFFVNGSPAVVVGDPVAGHGSGSHAGPVMTGGSPTFKINGKAAIRAGDSASCGHATNGFALFNIP